MAGTAGGNGAGILIQVKQVPAGAVTPQGVQKSLASLSEDKSKPWAT